MSESAALVDEAGNARAYGVSELAFALKRTIEDAYGFVRLRGELSTIYRFCTVCTASLVAVENAA